MKYKKMTAGNTKVLIVDDVEMNRDILEEIIKDMGCVPIMADGGPMALELIAKEHPHLVLTDISMPDMNGYELCRILKGNEETKKIPVVFISAFDDPEDIVKGFDIGGEDYITKPFIPAVVQARVGVQLRLHEVTEQLIKTNRHLQASVSEQMKQMEEEKKNILQALANAAAQNASYAQKHMERLGHNCRILAQGMQLSPVFEGQLSDTQIDTIEMAAPLCDIGNIGVSKEILRKKDALTQEEAEELEKHTSIGAQLLSDLRVNNDYNDFISTTIDMAKCHHENWNGSGYPEGRKGDDIPLCAQIVSIMDRYCDLTGEQAYAREKALEIMKEESGVKFNPDIYKICAKISRQFC